MKSDLKFQPWLHRYAVLCAVVTLGLIGLGGLLTSKEAGMAVPDWPTTYGYNMFLFPVEMWTGGIFYEHTHRLYASGVGFLTIGLMVWFFIKEPRKWMKWLGAAALLLVIIQGVLGGLRVTMFKAEIGIFHGALAQLFLALLAALALFTSRWWMEGKRESLPKLSNRWTPFMIAISVMIFVQLMLGAMMRHAHVGLAVPDFPLAYGQVWPDTSEAALEEINQQRMDVVHDGNVFYDEPLTPYHIHVHMVHRIGALLIFASILTFAVKTFRQMGAKHPVARMAAVWFGLICIQAGLGMATVLFNKPADVATLHVLTGAVALVFGILTSICVKRMENQWLGMGSQSSSRTSQGPAAEPVTA